MRIVTMLAIAMGLGALGCAAEVESAPDPRDAGTDARCGTNEWPADDGGCLVSATHWVGGGGGGE